MNGEYLRKLRIEAGLTQDEAAKALGYAGRAAISKIENDTFELSQDKIVQYAEILNVTPLVIMGLETKEQSVIREKKKHIQQMIENLPDDALDKLAEYISLLLLKYRED